MGFDPYAFCLMNIKWLTSEILFQVGKREIEPGAFVFLSSHQTSIYFSYPEYIATPSNEGGWDLEY